MLQAAFYAIAVLVAAGSAWMVSRAVAAGADDSRIRNTFIGGMLLWIAVVSAASYAGLLLPRNGRPLPFALLILAVVVLGVVIARSGAGALLARHTPLAILIAFQGFRLPLELAMHRAYVEGLMPVQMSYSGRNFDIVTGITALLLAAALRLGLAGRTAAWIWNLLGLALLVNVVVVAVLSTPVFAYFGPDHLNVWVMWMPYTLLPAVMVLAAWAGHLVIFRALRER